MKTSQPKFVLMLVIVPLTAFVAGTFFMGWWISPIQEVEADSRATVPVRNVSTAGSGDARGEVTKAGSQLSYYLPESLGMITNEVDPELPAEILKRITNGEYILQYEFPTARLGLSKLVALNVSGYQPVIDREYDALFKDLGLDETVAAKAKKHLASIQHARVEAEAYLIELDEAKTAYDEQMKLLLGPEHYRVYRETESARPAMRELANIKDYVEQAGGVPVMAPEETDLFEALRRSKRIPVYDGPYGEGAHASAGHDNVLAGLMEELNLLQTEYAELERNISGTSMSDDLRSKVKEYYDGQKRNKQAEIDRLTSGQ